MPSIDRKALPDDLPGQPTDRTEFRADLEKLINRHSVERVSNTPDFILADYLTDSLAAYDKAVAARSAWYK